MLWNYLRYIMKLSSVNLRWKKRNLSESISYQWDLMRWQEVLLLGETSDVRWQWWRCYSQLVVLVWVSQSWASRVFARVSFEKKNWKSLAESFNDFSVSCAMSLIRSETVLRDKLTLWNSLNFFWHAQLHSGSEAQIHLQHEVSAF